MMKECTEMEYHMDDLKQMLPTPRLNLPDVTEEACYVPKDGSPYMVFECVPSGRPKDGCPYCGSSLITVHGYLPQRRLVHDVHVGVEQVDLLVKIPRYICNDCSGTFAHRFESIPDKRQMTSRLYEQIKRDSFIRPFADIAAEFGYSIPTIGTIFDDYAEELEKQKGAVVAPRILGVDEKHIVHEMRGVFVDIETGTLLEMTPGNKKADIIDTIESMVDYDKNIQVVTMDMSNGYRSYIQECLPHAKIVVDKYHVFQLLSDKVRKTRKKIVEYLDYRIAQLEDATVREHLQKVISLVKNDSYLFKFGQERIMEKPSRVAAMADVCRTFPEFNHLRLLKEQFEIIYDAQDRQAAELVAEEWLKLVPPRNAKDIKAWETAYNVPSELYVEFKTLKNSLSKWHEEIFNYFDPGCNFTNAATEGLNNMIERINRQGNGYSFARLRAKALFYHLAAPKMLFKINTKNVPTLKKGAPKKPEGTTGMMYRYDIPYEYVEVKSIEVVDTPFHNRKPLSVFSYLPK